jgi:hypothetical protein
MSSPIDTPGQPPAGEKTYNFRTRKRVAPDPSPSRSASADASDRSDSPAGTTNIPPSNQEAARKLEGYLSLGIANLPNRGIVGRMEHMSNTSVPHAPARGETDNSTTAYIVQFTTAVIHLIRAPLAELEQSEPAWGSTFRNFFGQLAGRAMMGFLLPLDISAIFALPSTPTASSLLASIPSAPL